MKKIGMVLMVMLLVTVMSVGCAKNDDAQQNQVQQQEQQNQQQDAQQNQEGTSNDNAQDVQANAELLTLTGKFNGLADSHSVEVEVDGEATVFQFSDEGILERLEVMEEGTEIQFDAEFEPETDIRRMVKLYDEVEK